MSQWTHSLGCCCVKDILLGGGLALSATGAILLVQDSDVEEKDEAQPTPKITQRKSDHWDTKK